MGGGTRRSPLHPLLLAALVKLAFSCIADDEFLCDEATAHLQECCPEMNAGPIECDREFETCRGCKFDPHFSSTEINAKASTCLIEKDCDRIRASNICARLADPTKTDGAEVERIACAP